MMGEVLDEPLVEISKAEERLYSQLFFGSGQSATPTTFTGSISTCDIVFGYDES